MLTIWKSVGRGGVDKPNDVMHVQLLLNANYRTWWVQKLASLLSLWQPVTWAPGVWLVPDGKCGDKTKTAIEEFQRHVVKMFKTDARVDPGGGTITALTPAAKFMAPQNLTAQFEDCRLAGKKSQAMVGRITVNSRTYFFNTGGHGRGNLPPRKYAVTKHRRSRTEKGFSFAGVGYTFALNDTKDARLEKLGDKKQRELLRIHPDGGTAGTLGCIGILGGTKTQSTFRDDMYLEIKRGLGKATLNVRKLP